MKEPEYDEAEFLRYALDHDPQFGAKSIVAATTECLTIEPHEAVQLAQLSNMSFDDGQYVPGEIRPHRTWWNDPAPLVLQQVAQPYREATPKDKPLPAPALRRSGKGIVIGVAVSLIFWGLFMGGLMWWTAR